MEKPPLAMRELAGSFPTGDGAMDKLEAMLKRAELGKHALCLARYAYF